jgi:predicted nuclease of predicted toxin-antitoxin system
MAISLYMDQHVPRPITNGLRLRGIDVLTAAEDSAAELDDPDLLDRAATRGRVLFSQDKDLLVEATRRQIDGVPFSGVIYAHQLQVSIGGCVRDLELIATAANPADLRDQVIFLPL